MVRCACQSVITSHIFGIALGPKKRAFFTTKNGFIFKGLPRAGFRWFAATITISCCRLRFAGGSAAEAPFGHVVFGTQISGRFLVQFFGPLFGASY